MIYHDPKPRGRPVDEARSIAKLLGATKYEGAPCKRGHDGTRYTSTGACAACLNERN
jgi:hypothetical protein